MRWPHVTSWRHACALLLLLLALYNAVGALEIKAKAVLAPLLIERAWAATLDTGGHPHLPWPWADTWPVARMQVPSQGVDLPILAGGGGNAMAFAPGHSGASAPLGGTGVGVIGGHRDTHFSFLEKVRVGERVKLQLPGGGYRHYEVVSARVVDSRVESLRNDAVDEALLLVTCYPFDAILPNGPLRYVVRAEPL